MQFLRKVDLENLFFSYDISSIDYYDVCDVGDLTLSDTSSVYLDLTGNTKYSWQVAANNNWCDDFLQPEQVFNAKIIPK